MPRFVTFPAFGGQATVGATSQRTLEVALSTARETVSEFDLACSRFREDSEICLVNRSAGRPVRVSQTLFEALGIAVAAARLTDGDVDPTVGGALVGLGYDGEFSSLQEGRPVTVIGVPGWRRVKLDPHARTVTIPRRARVDLGATAKALAADRACARALEAVGDGEGLLISFSGDMATGGTPPAGGWRVRVTDDHRSDVKAPGQWIALSSGGLATSSTTVRSWRTAGGTAHHLVDPRTGTPTRGPWRTASVTAASCVEANVASTASLVRGAAAVDWLESLALPARLVDNGGHARHLAGWPLEGDDLR